jgi:hypothetical protein
MPSSNGRARGSTWYLVNSPGGNVNWSGSSQWSEVVSGSSVYGTPKAGDSLYLGDSYTTSVAGSETESSLMDLKMDTGTYFGSVDIEAEPATIGLLVIGLLGRRRRSRSRHLDQNLSSLLREQL